MDIRHETLKALQQNQRTLERTRIQMGNRLTALKNNPEVFDEVGDINQLLVDEITRLEKMVDAALAEALYEHKLWDYWLSGIYGIGPSIMPQILALLLPPLPERGPSTWYKAAGLIPEPHDAGRVLVQDAAGETLAMYPEKDRTLAEEHAARLDAAVVEEQYSLYRLPRARAGGDALTHHLWLRRCLWLQAKAFVMVGKGYYRGVYERKKNQLTFKHRGNFDWPPHRLDTAARWSMIRLFLAHVWQRWSEVEGLPDRKAYVVESLGHAYIPPPEPKRIGTRLIKM